MSTEKLKLPSYGGQALIEGVLMRGSHYLAAAMRAPDGTIKIEKAELGGIYTSQWAKIPFLRGLVILWDALGLGTKYLTLSANIQTGEEEKIEGPAMVVTLVVSFAIAIGLFFVAPAAIAQWLEKLLQWSSLWSNVLEGIARLLLVVGYIWAIGLMPDVRRVFGYHGAEHKTINAFEAGSELTPEKVKSFSTRHPRCGTAFLLTLVVFSIILFSFLGPMSMVWRLLSRIFLIPFLAMFAYEYIRWTARHLDLRVVRWLALPSLTLQALTTREPDLTMLEVSIASFNAMLEQEQMNSNS